MFWKNKKLDKKLTDWYNTETDSIYVNECKRSGPKVTIEKALLNANLVIAKKAGEKGDLERHLRVAKNLSCVIGEPIPNSVIDSMIKIYELCYEKKDFSPFSY